MKKKMIALYCSILLIVFLCITKSLYAEKVSDMHTEQSLESLEKSFIELPPETRRLTGPLFWLHGDESQEKLEAYVEKVAEGGNGCFTAESRPHNDWLGEGWFRDLKICLDAAKKQNLKMWIFDEKWWPSGEVGGNVPLKYGSKYLDAESVDVEGGSSYADPVSPEKLIAVLAGRVVDDAIDGNTLIDLTGEIKNDVLQWTVPQGHWKLMTFTWRYSKKHYGRYVVDGASQEAVDWYIQTVYQPHYDHFQEDFGTWIPGFFYDEPETHGDWGTEVIPMLKERGVDWKKALVAWKFALAGDEQQAAKYQYQSAFAEAWGKTLYGGVTSWCHEHNVRSIGHFLEHSLLYLAPHTCAGNMFQLQKYSDMGAIDAVFTQFIMGQREVMNAPSWQTPKLGSSISHVYGKADDLSMVEIFGARGQDLTYPEMKWWTDHMHVSGINFHIPHSFNPRSPYDIDCPPFFYNGGKEPRWPLYKVYADYTTRLSTMLSGGRHVCPVALLFVGNSYHAGKSVPPDQISEAMQDALYDCDWMPYEVFEDNVRLDKDEMTLYKERYRVLVVPPVEVIPYKTLEKAHQFFLSGGVVVGYDFLPSKSADLEHSSEEIVNLSNAIWGGSEAALRVCRTNAAAGRSYFLPANPTPEQIQQMLAGDANIHPTLEVLAGDTNHWLHVLHRVKNGRDVFFICNQNIDGGQRTFRFRIKAQGFPECWDPMRAEITSVPFSRKGQYVELSLKLDCLESTLLVFNSIQRDLPELIEVTDVQPEKVLQVMRLETPEQSNVEESITLESLDGCDWVWYPQQDAVSSAKPGSCYFRGQFDIQQQHSLSSARFIGTADNEIHLYINGKQVSDESGAFKNWKKLSVIDIKDFLSQKRNLIAIQVLNTADHPSPAGLIGKVVMEFADGSNKTVAIGSAWKVSGQEKAGWQNAEFDDSNWPNAETIASYGADPWGTVAQHQLTLSPVKKATPFVGQVDLPAALLDQNARFILRMTGVSPEKAARITINGNDVGGCISEPLVKDITDALTAGINNVRIEPFCPDKVQLLLLSN